MKMFPCLYDPTLPSLSFRLPTATSSLTLWRLIRMPGFIDPTSQSIQVDRHEGKAISVEQEVKAATGYFGDQGKVEESEK